MPAANPSFLHRLWRAVHGVLFPRYWLAVMAKEPLRLVLNSDGREVTIDGATRRVQAGDKVLASFDAVLSIDVVHHERNQGEAKPEHWSLSLYLGRSQRAFIGRSRKQAQVTQAAALLATITGKPVRTLDVLGPDSHIHSR
jgi:hypothetical protein